MIPMQNRSDNLLGELTANNRLLAQIRFIVAIDHLKSVLRQTLKIASMTQENDAEHSWHLAIMAIVLKEHTNDEIEILRVLKMVLIHDLVEIIAGDTFCYDTQGRIDQRKKEEEAAEQLFAMLPPDQNDEFRRLWIEFEMKQTSEAKYATALDRLQPLLLNYTTKGHAWQNHDVRSSQVFERNGAIVDGSSELWDFAEKLIKKSVENGYLKE